MSKNKSKILRWDLRVLRRISFPRTQQYSLVSNKINGCPHALDDVSHMVMVNGLVCCIAQMCVVAEGVTLFRTPYSPIVDHATRTHAK